MADDEPKDDGPKLKPLSDYTFYGTRELLEEMDIIFKERDEFISGQLQLRKMSIEMANLQRYRLNRYPMIRDVLKLFFQPGQDVAVRQKDGSVKLVPTIKKLSERPSTQPTGEQTSPADVAAADEGIKKMLATPAASAPAPSSEQATWDDDSW